MSKEPFEIFYYDITGAALSTKFLNKMKGVIDVDAIQMPSFGESPKSYSDDISCLTSGTLISSDLWMSHTELILGCLGTGDPLLLERRPKVSSQPTNL